MSSSPDAPIDDAFIDQTNTSLTDQLPIATSPDVLIGSNVCLASDSPILALADQPIETMSFGEYE